MSFEIRLRWKKLVDFDKLMKREKEIKEELQQLLNHVVGYESIELMVAVVKWYKGVNLKRREEMKAKLEEWLKENEALT